MWTICFSTHSLPWYMFSPQPPTPKINRLWVEAFEISQNKPFLLRNCLSSVFCYSNRKPIRTSNPPLSVWSLTLWAALHQEVYSGDIFQRERAELWLLRTESGRQQEEHTISGAHISGVVGTAGLAVAWLQKCVCWDLACPPSHLRAAPKMFLGEFWELLLRRYPSCLAWDSPKRLL